MSRRFIAALAALLCFGLTGMPVSRAGQSTVCVGRAEVFRIDPGLSMKSTAGTITTVLRGSEDCDGALEGHQPVGTIRTSHGITYGTPDPGSCAGVVFKGWADHAVPTARGIVVLRNHFTGYFDPLADPARAGTFKGERFSGRFGLRLLEGDCVTSPVTRFEAHWTGTWHGKGGT